MNHYESDAREIRRLALIMAHHAKSSHSGGALSMADILAVLYGGKLRITPQTVDDPNRDRFLLSKGHCCASLYAALAVHGFLDKEELCNNYGQDGTVYFSHVSHKLNGVEMSSGSLGHGLPVACGIALNGKVKGLDYDTYVLTGDGELDEGSCWEAIMFAAQQHLSHLCLIVDYNKIQSLGNVADICDLSPLADKFRAFNWNVIEIDGHNYDEIAQAIDLFKSNGPSSMVNGQWSMVNGPSSARPKGACYQRDARMVNGQWSMVNVPRPTAIIANTIKGKGVSYMEGELLWHYRNPNDEQLKQALEELA